MKITLVGSQTAQWLPSLAADLFFANKVNCEVWLHEGNGTLAKLAQDYLSTLADYAKAEASAFFTSDLKEALAGANAVIYADECQNSSRFFNDREALKSPDEKDPGLIDQARPWAGLEGLMMTLRVGSKALDLCEAMQEACPQAVVINLSKPLSQLTALFTQQGFTAYGLDSSHLKGNDGIEGLCRVLKKNRLAFQSAGLNGFAFLIQLSEDQANCLHKAQTCVKHGDWGELKKRWLDWYGMIPLGANHGQYLPAQPNWQPEEEPQLSESVEQRKERILQMNTVVQKGPASKEGAIAQVTLLSKVAPARPGQLVAALFTDAAITVPAVVQKNGRRMPQLPPEAMIEASLTAGGENPPITFTQEAAAIMEEIASVHLNSAKAAAGDRQALRAVIEEDPALSGLDRLYCLDVIEALIRMNEDALSRF
ncbi:MAG: hypothetical protein IJ461_06760 [Clostridia bacterium]|nr:hypothetical protein [Clostridia bacterium]